MWNAVKQFCALLLAFVVGIAIALGLWRPKKDEIKPVTPDDVRPAVDDIKRRFRDRVNDIVNKYRK
jgi:hypothetical protein